MDSETIIKMIASLLTLNGNIIQLFVVLKDRNKWMNKIGNQLGSLGITYTSIIKFPHVTYYLLLIPLLILSFLSVYIGCYRLYDIVVPTIMKLFVWAFDNSLFLGIIYSIILIPIQLNLFSKILLWIFSLVDGLYGYYAHYNVGWINANWQLNHYEDYYAMNVNELNIRKIANLIIGLIKSGEGLDIKEKAIEPEGLNNDEKANYLLFKVAIEKPINQLYPRGESYLSESHKYLAAVSKRPERPFSPQSIMEFNKKHRSGSYYHYLRSLMISESEGSLPNDPFVEQVVHSVYKRLVRKYKGDAEKLARNIIHRNGSPKLLLNRLKNFMELGNEYLRLFLKISVRMNIWPKMNPGPFLFPYSNGLALFFLNSFCIETTSDVNRIEIDKDFKSLTALVEEKLVEQVNSFIKSSAEDEEMISFIQYWLSSSPKEINFWQLCDKVDLWLWQYTRNHCQRRTDKQPGQKLNCKLLTSGSQSICYCDAVSSIWKLEGDVFARK